MIFFYTVKIQLATCYNYFYESKVGTQKSNGLETVLFLQEGKTNLPKFKPSSPSQSLSKLSKACSLCNISKPTDPSTSHDSCTMNSCSSRDLFLPIESCPSYACRTKYSRSIPIRNNARSKPDHMIKVFVVVHLFTVL